MKKILVSVIASLAIFIILAQMGILQIFNISKAQVRSKEKVETASLVKNDKSEYVSEGDISYRVKTEGDYFYVYSGSTWNQVFWKGVNIGSGIPGSFPGELSVTYEDYYRWFEYISSMNANCIRVYTALLPDFYNALYDFNSKTDKPLYLFQGVWLDEADIRKYNDIYAENSKIYNQFKDDALQLVSIIHGDATLEAGRTGYAYGTYTSDVSKWFAGWILGMEFDPYFIQNINTVHYDKALYQGEYLYTSGSTPFEAFLADIGDSVIKKETEKYNWQVPVAFSNWVTTDPLNHPEEPDENEDTITLNVESIKAKNTFMSGQFVSYHIYPYYPDTMNYQHDYINYVDSTGKINTYEAYLKDLKKVHTRPIIVAEFGVATSRGVAHKSLMNYNQGNMDETDAGNALVDMFRSIYKAKYAGGIVFTWQDEWFKRTWNNEDFDDSERRPFWSNVQTCEQAFGLMSFDPGEQTACVLDGKANEWSDSDIVSKNSNGTLSMKTDEAYVYFMVKAAEGYNFDNDTILIPLDTIANQGNNKVSGTGVSFSSDADFMIKVNGKDNSRIVCDAYYDSFYYLFAERYQMIERHSEYKSKNSGIFNPINMCLGYEVEVPSTKQLLPFNFFETGKLLFGTTDVKSESYKSLSDIYQENGIVEIRIPWQILNFTDPSNAHILDDFYTRQSFTSTEFSEFHTGFAILKSENDSVSIDMSASFKYSVWKNKPTSHERLKKSYYILKKGLAEYDN